MANSKIVITFNSDLDIGTVISWKRNLIGDANKILQEETFVTIRTANYQVPVNTPQATPGVQTAIDFMHYFNIDYNGSGLYTISRNLNIVTLELVNNLWELSEWATTWPSAVGVITNYVAPSFSFIAEPYATFLPATDVCNNIKVELETNELATKITLNGVVIDSNNILNPVPIEFPRGVNYQIILENAAGDKLYYPGITYDLYGNPVFIGDKFDFLAEGNISLEIIKSLVGATLVVSVINIRNLTLEYSLDNINWQSSNTFTGQPLGAGIMYVRDQFGCVKSISYTVNELGTREPFLKISRANAFSFKEQVDADEQTIFRNETNSLTYQGSEKVKFCDERLVNLKDSNDTQIKSNYEQITATLRNEEGVEVVLPITKRTSNLNRFKKMDAWYYNYENQYTGIYFETGNTYDEFNSIIGPYTLNGNLPDFAIIGQYVTLDGLGTFKIIDVLFDPVIKKRVIIIDNLYLGLNTQTVVESIYDLLPFEVYEFTVNWETYGNGIYDILLENTDTYNGTVHHVSENIRVANSHKDTVAIRYYNENNRDIFYKYGIQHFIRVPIIHRRAVPKDETEINIVDTGIHVGKSTVQEFDEFIFDFVSEDFMRKIVIALSCENLYIQDIGYAKDGSVSSDNEEGTNAYDIKAVLARTGVNYTNNRKGEIGKDFGVIDFDIPSLLTTGDEFVKL